jgi:hypothetical protein
MTKTEAHDTLETLGNTLAERRRELQAAIADAQARLSDFDAAWAEHDYTWLANERFISTRIWLEAKHAVAMLEG